MKEVEGGQVLTDADARKWLRETNVLLKQGWRPVREWCESAASFFVSVNRQALSIYTICGDMETVEVYDDEDAFQDAVLMAAEFYCDPADTRKKGGAATA